MVPEDRNETTENDVDEGWLVPRHRGEWRTGTDFVGGVRLENEVGVGEEARMAAIENHKTCHQIILSQ